MKSLISVIVLFVFLVTLTHARFGLELLEGTWEAKVKNADVAILTEQGLGTICRDLLPPDCEAEIPLGDETYTFNQTSLTQRYSVLEGVTTMNQSANIMPICASHGFYPTEFAISVPLGKIVSYNRFDGHLVYQDTRKGGDFDCILVNYQLGPNGPFVDVRQNVRYTGDATRFVNFGIELRCMEPPTQCKAGVSNEGVVDLDFMNTFNLTCTAGSCLDLEQVLKTSCRVLNTN